MRTTNSNRWRRAAAVTAVAALGLTACGGAPDDGDTEAGGSEGGGEGGGGEAGDGEVSVLGALIDQDAANFEASMEAFTEETGIDVVYEGSGDFETLIVTRVEGGNAPDVALFPQPGLLEDVQARDALVPLDYLEDTDGFVSGLTDLTTIDDTLYGIPYRLNVKSLVWYPEPEFSDAGYEEPETWADLVALQEQIIADGTTPWCIGIESAGATGWTATDWIEDIMLRVHGADVYDQWVNHEVLFDSPEVTTVMEDYFNPIWLNDEAVLGGTQAILTTPFGDSPTPMFSDPPNCFLHRQASFIRGFFPDGVTAEDFGFFYLPPVVDGGTGDSPVLSAGDLAAALSDDEEAQQFMEYLNTPESGEVWAGEGSFISPFTDFDQSLYPDDVTREQAEIVLNADAVRFDASDTMPGAVGAGAFWTEMVAYINGQELQPTLANIDAAWPEDDAGSSGGSESEG